jgi:hypothetical protein
MTYQPVMVGGGGGGSVGAKERGVRIRNAKAKIDKALVNSLIIHLRVIMSFSFRQTDSVDEKLQSV